MRILQAPKLYLDTSHLINIAKIRNGEKLPTEEFRNAYAFIDECIRDRHFGLIFNPYALLEWTEGEATPASAGQIAAVIDSAKLQYELEQDAFIYAQEILQECQRLTPNIRIPKLPVLHQRIPDGTIHPALGILATQVPNYLEPTELPAYLKDAQSFPTEVRVTSAADYVQHGFRYKKQNPDMCNERVEGFKDALSNDIKHADLFFKSPKRFIIDWIKRFLRMDKILDAFNSGLDINTILGRIDIAQCPSVKLFFDAREKRIRAGHPPKDNEVDDWLFLPVVSYADLVLLDGNFLTFILQADRSLESKVVSDPVEAVGILQRWTS